WPTSRSPSPSPRSGSRSSTPGSPASSRAGRGRRPRAATVRGVTAARDDALHGRTAGRRRTSTRRPGSTAAAPRPRAGCSICCSTPPANGSRVATSRRGSAWRPGRAVWRASWPGPAGTPAGSSGRSRSPWSGAPTATPTSGWPPRWSRSSARAASASGGPPAPSG
ncbi:MAG: hypothetical protein AVDCRST_MAG79-870, partial [uncultured Thermoleophilia bacterium]